MTTAAIKLDKVSVTYGKFVRALDEVSLELASGETVGLIGESGSGKSTLCRVLLGLTNATAGSAEILGQSVAHAISRDKKAFRCQVQMLMQDATATLSPRMTINDLFMEAVSIHGLDASKTQQHIAELLAKLKLPTSLLARYPHQISGGQARRVGVIRALLLNPTVLVADEPTAGLDVSVQGELLNLLLEFQRELGLTFLMVSHNLHVIKRVTGRTVVMYLGQIIEDAATSALFKTPAHPYTTTLVSTNPLLSAEEGARPIILKGEIPSNSSVPDGCRFHTRCPVAQEKCSSIEPALTEIDLGRRVRCHFPFSLTKTGPAAGATSTNVNRTQPEKSHESAIRN
ncbi:oligopeptide/dipeptide ABC transporter ATP-binding protein [Brucella pseudogrignonensis]|uniref:oligopeptide/dipeptide ABC transporter ATP-binding protein n=1 Tax=Brucella pseudogrignonensis TaxID=419475 RepID=UPI003ECDC789